ncbi:MAG: hypothetical protein EOO01_24480, partial [Chitinophagaceae bacterium]
MESTDFSRDSGQKPQSAGIDLQHLALRNPEMYINIAGSDFLRLGQNEFGGLGSIKTAHIFNDTLLLAGSSCAKLFSINEKETLETLYTGRTTCAFRQKDVYYIGTVYGLYRKLPDKTIQFMGKYHPNLTSQISQMIQGKDDILWISTYGQGIIGFKDNKVVAVLEKKNGLTSDICRCMHFDGNSLWIGTDKGLNKVNTAGRIPYVEAVYRETDGLNSDIINCIYTSGKVIYVGTAMGMTVFDETRIPARTFCDIKLNSVIVSGQEKSGSDSAAVLPHDDNNIRFGLSGISFLSGGDLTFKYRLSGLNQRWATTRENVLAYPSLPSGSYELQIFCINKFGDRSRMLVYAFVIEKSMWEEWWFRIGLLIILASAIGFTVRFIVRRSQAKEKQKLSAQHQLMKLEQMALQMQLNPHFIFNSIATIKQYYNVGSLITGNKLVDMFAS